MRWTASSSTGSGSISWTLSVQGYRLGGLVHRGRGSPEPWPGGDPNASATAWRRPRPVMPAEEARSATTRSGSGVVYRLHGAPRAVVTASSPQPRGRPCRKVITEVRVGVTTRIFTARPSISRGPPPVLGAPCAYSCQGTPARAASRACRAGPRPARRYRPDGRVSRRRTGGSRLCRRGPRAPARGPGGAPRRRWAWPGEYPAQSWPSTPAPGSAGVAVRAPCTAGPPRAPPAILPTAVPTWSWSIPHSLAERASTAMAMPWSARRVKAACMARWPWRISPSSAPRRLWTADHPAVTRSTMANFPPRWATCAARRSMTSVGAVTLGM